MSTPVTPITPADSQRQESTQPSSPVESQEEMKARAENGEEQHAGSIDDDLEGMDVKAKALMHLLKTSSVWISFCL